MIMTLFRNKREQLQRLICSDSGLILGIDHCKCCECSHGTTVTIGVHYLRPVKGIGYLLSRPRSRGPLTKADATVPSPAL